MKLQATQENLAKALNTVARVANTRNTLPILSNVVLRTVGNRLSIAATNLDIAITHYVGSKVTNEGAITVPARLMQDFITSLPTGVINLDLTDHKLHITTDKYESTINGISADEFPVMPTLAKGEKWTIPANTLKRALQQVVMAASSDDARPILTGVYVHTNEGKLMMVATDSYRLAEKSLGANKTEVSLLIPASSMHDVLRILGDFEDEVEVIHDDQQVLFRVGDIELVTRLVEGNYPDYRRLIPKTFTTQATLKKADFINITKVSSLFARESAGSVTIKVSDKLVSIRSIASQLGENTASASANILGSGEITVNSRYLLDALQAFSGENVLFGFNGKLEPCILQDPEKDDYLHVVMPLKS